MIISAFICVYIYGEKERERERERDLYNNSNYNTICNHVLHTCILIMIVIMILSGSNHDNAQAS